MNTKFKVIFNFNRFNSIGVSEVSSRFYEIYALYDTDAIAEAKKLFEENEPTASDVKISIEVCE